MPPVTLNCKSQVVHEVKGLVLKHLARQPLKRGDGKPPLLILLHGVGSNEQDLMGLAPLLDPRFLVVSARAPITLGVGSFAWFHVQFTPTGIEIDPQEAEQSRLEVLKFVEAAISAYDADPRHVFLMGFSQGCIMSLSAALTEPRKFAGVVGMSGRILPEVLTKTAPPDQLRGLPILIVHGTLDSVLPIEHGRDSRELLAKLPVELEYIEYPMAHQVSQESMEDITRWLRNHLDNETDWRERQAEA
jgi:phospholipase/carboxylesterase